MHQNNSDCDLRDYYISKRACENVESFTQKESAYKMYFLNIKKYILKTFTAFINYAVMRNVCWGSLLWHFLREPIKIKLKQVF